MPSIGNPWWLLAPLLAVLVLAIGRHHALLPGNWHRAIDPDLQGFLNGSVEQVRKRPLALALACLWLLLGAALATISFGETDTPSLRDLDARVVVIDLGVGDASQGRVAAARYLIDSTKDVPTAVVAVTEHAFDVVPLTRDATHLDRYLQVLTSDVMPIQGRSLIKGIERGVALLDRAGIQARQITVFTDGAPPPIGRFRKPDGSQDHNIWLVMPDQITSEWQRWAGDLDAHVVTDRNMSAIITDLEERRRQAAAKAVSIRERRDLTPWLIALILPLWLLVFFRRQTD